MFLTGTGSGSGSVGIADMGMLIISGKLIGAGGADLVNTGMGLLTASMDVSLDVTAIGSTIGLLVEFTCLVTASIEVFLGATAIGSIIGFAVGTWSILDCDEVCLVDEESFDIIDFSS